MSSDAPHTLLLFPLRTVLLPGAACTVRVVDPRELAAIRGGGALGVCPALGVPPAKAGHAARVGTEARIIDIGSDGRGALILQLRGRRRFHVDRARQRVDGLVEVDIQWREPDSDDPLRPEHALLATVLQHMLDQVGGEHARAPTAQLDDAAWVGWRLAELLPLDDVQREALLQDDDLHARLDRLLGWLS